MFETQPEHAIPHEGDRSFEAWCATEDEELGRPAPDKIIEHGTPRFGDLAAHALDRE